MKEKEGGGGQIDIGASSSLSPTRKQDRFNPVLINMPVKNLAEFKASYAKPQM